MLEGLENVRAEGLLLPLLLNHAFKEVLEIVLLEALLPEGGHGLHAVLAAELLGGLTGPFSEQAVHINHFLRRDSQIMRP